MRKAEPEVLAPDVDRKALRQAVVAYLQTVKETTAARITAAVGMQDHPSMVVDELNAMRTDALVECEKKKGRGAEYWYWLTSAAMATEIAAPAMSPEAGEPDPAQELDDLPARTDNYAAAVEQIHATCRDAGIPAGKVTDRVEGMACRLKAEMERCAAMEAEFKPIRADYHSAGDILGEITGDCDSPRDLWELAKEAQKKIEGLTADLATMRQAREVLLERMTAEPAVDVKDAAKGYLVRAPKRKPRIVTKAETAVAAAMAAARNGSGRGEVFALVPIGTARRGAEWRETK